MLRSAATQLTKVCRGTLATSMARTLNTTAVRSSHAGLPDIYDPEFDSNYVKYFSRPEIDGWEIRKGMNDLLRMDLIPDPEITKAVLHACRRLNDYALTTRWLEGVKDRCGPHKDIYKWIIDEVQPTLTELGISTPEELGYAVPELAMKLPHEY